MKKCLFIMIGLFVLAFALGGISYGWQGRMGGMGDPYGLVADESDFLFNPAGIAKGEGVRFYGDYRFLYTGVTDWDVDFTDGGAISIDMSGHELRHDALVGAAFPLSPGRIGLFFTYDGMRGDFDTLMGGTTGLELSRDLDAFALRLLYGLPVGSFKLGGELGFAYRQEENESFIYQTDLSGGAVNQHIMLWPGIIFFPTFVPYDSAYWEIPFKAGIEGVVGPFDVEFALRGGFIASGDNTLAIRIEAPVGVVTDGVDLDGDIRGWRIGGDFWLRYPLGDGLTLPFLVKMDYQEKTRDGDGAIWSDPTAGFDYDNKETSLHLVVGGGLDKELAQGTRIAGGLYYGYLHDTEDFFLARYVGGVFDGDLAYGEYPALTEHRVMVHLAGEHDFSPLFALRLGLEGFYGWATEDLTMSQFVVGPPPALQAIDISSHGSHWGIGASFGGSIRFKPITLEPFVNAGFQSLDLSGDGGAFSDGVLTGTVDRDDTRNQWYIGGGLSVLFDVP